MPANAAKRTVQKRFQSMRPKDLREFIADVLCGVHDGGSNSLENFQAGTGAER